VDLVVQLYYYHYRKDLVDLELQFQRDLEDLVDQLHYCQLQMDLEDLVDLLY
jgi:hypothetical protein